jgi:type I restriction enzyme S subunit
MKFGLEQHIIDKLITVFEQHSKVDKALVFGSRAKGNYRPDSDIDIAIKGHGLNTDDIIAMCVAFEEKGITHKIDLINYQSIKEPDLKEHIDRVGIDFYSRWKIYKFGDIAQIIGGGTPSTSNPNNWNGDIPWLTPRDLTGYTNVYISKGERNITNEGLTNSSARMLPKGSVLLTSRAPIGYVVIASNEICTNQGFKNLILNETIAHNLFIYYWLKNNVEYLQSIGTGTTFAEISASTVKDVDIELPPLSEQKEIASVLNSIDLKIELLQSQNKTLEQLAETLFRQWFVEDAEESWETKKVSEIIEIRDGTHDSPKQTETGKFLITSKHLKPTGIDFSSAYKISENDFIEVNKRSKVDKDDILFSMIGTLGLIHYVDQEPDFAIKNIGLFKSSQKPSFARFLFLLLISPEGKRFVYENADGSTQEYITLGSLRKFEFKYPGEKRIIEFDLEVKPIFQKIDSNTSQIRSLTQTRDTLLPKLMSGEVMVNLN